MSEAGEDAAARECATDPQRSVLLQAPAGSGKTTVLTERLLRLLAQVAEPEEILAVTFTRKAAAEMRGRVLGALQGEPGTGARAERLRALADAVLARSAARGWRLEQDPARLRIQTLDAFNLHLASRLPVTARGGTGLTLLAAPQALYAAAARTTLMEGESDPALAPDLELLFQRLDNNYGLFERLLAAMLAERAHWLRHLLAEPEDLAARVQESLAGILAAELEACRNRIPATLRARLAALPEVGPLEADPAALPGWQRLARAVLKGDGDWRARIDRHAGAAFAAAEARETLRECIGLMRPIPGLRERLAAVRDLPGPLSEPDRAALAALTRVLRQAAMQLHHDFALQGRVDYTFVAGAARAALTESGLPTELALEVGLGLRHVLVDEFQDTSLAQFELLEALTAGWEAGDGRSLFLVGDPMQSIYQFREAEVGLFIRARERGIGAVRLEALSLSRNFRSSPALIGWNNDTFARLFPAGDALRTAAIAFRASAPGSPPGPPLQSGEPVRLRLHADAAAQARGIAQRVAALRQEQPRCSIAVLVAARSHATPIVRALEAAGLEAAGVDLVPLAQLPIVRDLLALTQALHHLADRSAWLAVLRAPWCGARLATLTALVTRGDPACVWDALQESARLEALAPEERARLERVREVLGRALAAPPLQSPAAWIERTWLGLGGAECYPVGELAHARAFFDALAARAAEGDWNGPEDLPALLAELCAAPAVQSAQPVQVMTIHRAKGLEFDHVFLPALERALNHDRDPLLRWLDLPRADGGSDLLLAPLAPVGPERGASDLGRYMRRLAAERAAHEQVRLLYVACTRARRSLELSACPEWRDDAGPALREGTLLKRLWPVLGEQFLRLEADGPGAAAEAPEEAGRRLGRLPRTWSLPQPDAAARMPRLPLAQQSLEPPEFSWVGATMRQVGTVVHAALEALAARAVLPDAAAFAADPAHWAAELARHGVPAHERARAAQIVHEALVRTLADVRGRWILARHREARSELALTGLAGGRLASVVIDRSFVDEAGTRWVIDFKTSRHEGGGREAFLDQELQRYRSQLEGYLELAGGLGPEPVRAALYFPLMQAFREL